MRRRRSTRSAIPRVRCRWRSWAERRSSRSSICSRAAASSYFCRSTSLPIPPRPMPTPSPPSWGRGTATVAAVAIAISAFGALNCLILATGELGFSMAQRGDLPRALAGTRGANTPVTAQLVGSVLTILLILANSSRATAGLFTFIILLSTAAAVLYGVGALAAWKQSRASWPARRDRRRIDLRRLRFLWRRV